MLKPTRTPERIELPNGCYWKLYASGPKGLGAISVNGSMLIECSPLQASMLAAALQSPAPFMKTDGVDFSQMNLKPNAISVVQSPAGEWRDRQTMPRDGKNFLVLTADFEHGRQYNERIQQARWDGKTPTDPKGAFKSGNGQFIVYWHPILLPPAPTEEG